MLLLRRVKNYKKKPDENLAEEDHENLSHKQSCDYPTADLMNGAAEAVSPVMSALSGYAR